MEQDAPFAPEQAIASRDATVTSILNDLEAATNSATGSYFEPMARAVGLIRGCTFASGPKLLQSQKVRLIRALGEAFNSIYPVMADDYERRELTMSLNSVGHLVLVWAGDLPNAGPAVDAHDFALAHELNLIQMAILDRLAARGRAMQVDRARIFAGMLTPTTSDKTTEH